MIVRSNVSLACAAWLLACVQPMAPVYTGELGELVNATEASSDSFPGSGYPEWNASGTSGETDGDTLDILEGCGNALPDAGETCDDGFNDGRYNGCMPGCMTRGPHCGDGILDPLEACDDVNLVVAGICTSDCTYANNSCSINEDCIVQGETCIAGQCAPRGGDGDPCDAHPAIDNTDCADGFLCDTGTCRAAATCVNHCTNTFNLCSNICEEDYCMIGSCAPEFNNCRVHCGRTYSYCIDDCSTPDDSG